MCGIAGFLGDYTTPDSQLKEMANAIHHRGPDDQGIWFDKVIGIGLAHARLSIIDLSAAGHQPMQSASDRYVMVFNGEIYNHLALRTELDEVAPRQWRGHSDTETLLAGFEAWGIEGTIQKCAGMFALAVWDNQLEQLTLVRDRFGEKPLYYGWQNKTFMFASELKALKVHPDFENKINRDALSHYFRLNYIPTPLSIYENIFKLEPTTIASFSKDGKLLSKHKYWDLESLINNSVKSEENDAVLIEQLEALIKRSIDEQQISDVPLGAFLSGGIDSSTVVGVLQGLSGKPVKTFTIGFEQGEFNEANEAKAVATYLGTDHTELTLTPEKALSVIEKLPAIYDEPFADASQIPTYLVAEIAKRDVTVVLSGDGGDELFCGYNRYHYTQKVWSKLKKLPLFFRSSIASVFLAVSPLVWDRLGKVFFLDKKFPNLGNKIQKSARVLKSRSISELYLGLVSNWSLDEMLVKGSSASSPPLLSKSENINSLNDLEKMMLWDMQSYLMDDVLVKTDRATMACSLEGRVPLLDYRIAEFAAKLPSDIKLRNGQGKWILRQVLYKYVPKELIERPKKGFSLPLAEWLRGPLKAWAEKLLDSSRIDREGYLESGLIETKWKEHLAGKRDWSSQLWSVLMFQLWLEQNR